MRHRAWFCLVLALAASSTGAAQPPKEEGALALRSEELNLSVGENKTIPAGDVQSYSEGKRGIAG
jgi:hypothetical protein